MKRKLVFGISFVCVLVALLSTTAAATTEPSLWASGSCGENATYTITSDRVLTISGTGRIDGSEDFENYKWSVNNLIINPGITVIGTEAFAGLGSLRSVSLPETLKVIERFAFVSNYALETISLPNSIEKLEYEAFHVNVPLQYNIYENCNYLGNEENPYLVLMGSTVTTAETVTIHADTKIIHGRAFYNHTALSEVNLPSGLTYIGDEAFAKTKISSVVVPGLVQGLGDRAFQDCVELTSVEITSGTPVLGEWLFSGCSKLETVVLPDTLKEIGDNAFSGCTNLKSIIFDGNAENYFEVIQGTGNSIDSLISFSGNYVYSGVCGDAIWYALDSTGTLYIRGTGEMDPYFAEAQPPNYSNSMPPWYDWRNQIKTVVLDGSISAVGNLAFNNCLNLETIVLPSTITTLGDYSFYECKALVNIVFPKNLKSIGKYAFYGCTGLTGITPPQNVEVGACAFDTSGDSATAFNKARALMEATYDYLNEVYLDEENSDLVLDLKYVSLSDKAILKKLADQITSDCTTDKEKCDAIYRWVKANISVDGTVGGVLFNGSQIPMDVLRRGSGVCTGHAHLTQALLKSADIPAAVVRGVKCNPSVIDLDFIYKKSARYQHEWVMAYCGDTWYAYDTLWDIAGISDLDELSKTFFVYHVDGVLPYCDEGVDILKGKFRRGNPALYIDGKLYGGAGSMSIANYVRYHFSSFVSSTDSVYYQPLSGDVFSSLEERQCWPAGWYRGKVRGREVWRTLFNGEKETFSVAALGDTLYFEQTAIAESLAYRPLIQRRFGLYTGEQLKVTDVFDFESMGSYSTVRYSGYDSNICSISEDGVITALSGGTTSIILLLDNTRAGEVELFVYGTRVHDEIGVVRSLCKHENTHYVELAAEELGVEDVVVAVYCDYCGEEISAKVVTSIKMIDLPSKLRYSVLDKTVDISGGKIMITYADDSTSTIDLSAEMVSGFDNAAVGEQTIMVTYGGKTCTFKVEIVDRLLASVAIEELPAKLVYLEGEGMLDLTGGVLVLNYDDGTSAEVPLSEASITGFDNSVVGRQVLTVTYEGKTCTFEVEIVVKRLVSITVKELPAKLSYLEGKDALDLADGSLSLWYNDGSTVAVSMSEAIVTGFDNSIVGKQVLTVTYEGKTCTFEVEIVAKRLVSVGIKRLPNKLTYLEGMDVLDLTGGLLELSYNNGTAEEVSMSEATVTGFDNSVVGIQGLTVTYKGKICSIGIEIVAKSLSFVTVKALPVKLNYLEGTDTLDLAGGVLILNYNNETTAEINMSEAVVTGFDNTVAGKQTLTVTYEGKNCTFEVEIDHDKVDHEAKVPTCTEIGWEAYVTCTRCDYTTYVEKSKLGHAEVDHEAKAPTCTEIGWDAYVTCSRCDYSTYVEKAKLGHGYADAVFEWMSDFSAVTATRVCHCGHEEEAACTLEWTTYTDGKLGVIATAEFGEDVFREQREITVSKRDGVITIVLPDAIPGLRVFATTYAVNGQMTATAQAEINANTVKVFSEDAGIRIFFLTADYRPITPVIAL